MKRIAALLFATVLLLALPACTDKHPGQEPTTLPTSAPTTLSTSAPTTLPTSAPTTLPTSAPTTLPTSAPTTLPTSAPTTSPTLGLTDFPAPGPNFPGAPILILNGEKLDVYTSHYGVTEEYAVIPLTAFLMSVGAEYADSPLNEYGIQCYSFMGKRYIVVPNMHLFMLEDDYRTLLKELNDQGKWLSRETVADCGLLPRNESKVLDTNETDAELAGIWVDHISLMNALIESGIDITIEYDYSTRTITVTLPKQDA